MTSFLVNRSKRTEAVWRYLFPDFRVAVLFEAHRRQRRRAARVAIQKRFLVFAYNMVLTFKNAV